MSTISLHPSIFDRVTATFRALPAWKRGIDLVCCLLAFPGLVLLTLLLAIGMKLVSPGPVIFRQERIGWKGRRFWLYKFRTMHVATTPRGARPAKEAIGRDERGEARMFAGSWLLRASGFDELPQLINVLRGEMSMIGPRPCLPAEFSACEPWQRKRCEAVPGLTGLWQVSGENDTTLEEMIQLDLRYAETVSPGLDAKIFLLTIPAMVRRIIDAARGKRSMVPTAHTIPPF
ncbi:MAG TPA: sugar transferase [Lacunisphaera sp.]|nr:sugar transferase [Lacunisphaera sp.]